MHFPFPPDHFPAARFIKDIGRGKAGARGMSRDDARELYAAMLDGRVSDLELGGILLAMRIKGESTEEIAGFLDAAEASLTPIEATPALSPAASSAVSPGDYAPIVLPSYNGARHMANLTPLLALLLARAGAPVLLHGVTTDPMRVTSAEIFAAMGHAPATTAAEAQQCFARGLPAFMPIEHLAPKMARLLDARRVLGVRNSTHTLVKILQPFAGPALRLTSYTHPEYLEMLAAYFGTLALAARGDAFLMRGTEGETVASARRAQQIDWFHGGCRTVLVQKQDVAHQTPSLPESRDAATTAAWIAAVLRGEQPVPAAIDEQVEQCLRVAREIQQRPTA